jgi:hypothetical protein
VKLFGVYALFVAPAIAAFLPREARTDSWIFVVLLELGIAFLLLS